MLRLLADLSFQVNFGAAINQELEDFSVAGHLDIDDVFTAVIVVRLAFTISFLFASLLDSSSPQVL